MASDPVLAARSALGHAAKTGDLAQIRAAREALARAKADRLHNEFDALVASINDGPATYCCPRCRDKGACT